MNSNVGREKQFLPNLERNIFEFEYKLQIQKEPVIDYNY